MIRPWVFLSLLIVPSAVFGQSEPAGNPVVLPSGTPLPVRVPDHLPMRLGELVRGELLYPVYVDNKLAIPVKTVVTGRIVALTPDHSRRVHARLLVDFTPYHVAVIHFDTIVPPTGPAIAIHTNDATDGAPVYRVVPKPAAKGGVVGEYFRFGVQHVKDTVAIVTGPEKGDRFLQFIYAQLPYRPERIARGTAWTVETTSALSVDPIAAPVMASVSPGPVAASPGRPTWTVQAYLNDAISSETSKAGQAIHATVAEPILNTDGTVAVPQGTLLSGTVTAARPARRFTRAGQLRFRFTELTFPGQVPQTVRTTLAGADSAGGQQMAMDSEGEVKPKAPDRIFLPALLIIMASQPFDHDHHGGEGDHMLGKDAVASSGLGLISLIVGTAAQQPNVAIGIGYYRAALSIYPRYFARGTAVAFPKDTRVVIQTTATRTTAIKPEPNPDANLPRTPQQP